MAESSNDGHGGMPLETFTKSTPPGWRPGDQKYPFRRYEQLIGLWLRMTDLSESARGPAMTGRLRGTAFQMAMAMTVTRCQGPTSLLSKPIGADLLGQASIPEFTTTDTNELLLLRRQAIRSFWNTLP